MHFHYALFAEILRDLAKTSRHFRRKIFFIAIRCAIQPRLFIWHSKRLPTIKRKSERAQPE